MRLQNKNCVITGSIGKETAKLFHEHGANLSLIGRDVEKLRDLKSEFKKTENILFRKAGAINIKKHKESYSRNI